MFKQIITFIILTVILAACAHHPGHILKPCDHHKSNKAIIKEQVAIPEVKPLPKGVSIHKLDNGMEVLLIENPALPMVGVNVVVKTGSAYETFAVSGMSHFLEHLLFNGTEKRTQKELYDAEDRIGGYNNANTSQFFTNYMMVTPAEHIKAGMDIQADMLFHSIMPPKKYKKEKGIVLEEISKSLVNPNEQLERNIISILYKGHALSLPVLGTYTTVEKMPREAVYNYYKNKYVPNNMILSAVGNFKADEMLAAINEIYGSSKPGEIQQSYDPEWAAGFQKPKIKSKAKVSVYHRFYNGKQTQLQLFYNLPQSLSSEAFELLDMALEDSVDVIQSKIKSQFPDMIKSLKFQTRPSTLANYLQLTLTLEQKFDLNGITKSTAKILSNINLTLSDEKIQAMSAKARTGFLKNIEKPHMFGIYNAYDFAVNGIEAVLAAYSGEGYNKGAKQLKQINLNSKPLIIVQHPVKEEEKQAAASVSTKLFETNPDKSKDGLEVIAVQNEAGSLLAVHYLLKHKAKYESKYGKNAAKILHDCFEQRLEADENQRISAKHGLTYTMNDNPYIPMDNIYLHPDFGYMRVEGLADDCEGVFTFLNNQLQNFAPTQQEFEKAIMKYKRLSVMMSGKKAKALFDKTYRSIIYEPEKYTAADEVTYENLLAFTKEYFQPANMIVSVVSPLDPGSVNNLLSSLAQKQKGAGSAKEAAVDRGMQLIEKPANVEKDGGGKRSYLFWGFINTIDPKDKPALKALSLILADHIIFDIREKQGMAYGMSAGIELNEDKALFYIRMGTRPQNVDKLMPQYPGFFDPKLIEPVTADELEKSINMYLGRMMFRRLSSINQAYYLAHSLYFHGDIEYDMNFFNELKNVKLDDVKQAAKKYMRINNPVSVIVR